MKFKIFESVEFLYHVTHTRLISKIRKEGLIPMKTSNWVKQGDMSRYGEGEIYAFDNMTDAARWAAKMDWDFNQKMGSGDISIIKFKGGEREEWEEDESDPLSRSSAMGKWVKKFTRIMPEDIVGVIPFTEEMAKKLTVWGKDIGDIFNPHSIAV